MTAICCFPPIEDEAATRLILGSMPGKESLRVGQYYAHPRNAFWKIMGELVGAGPELAYEIRTRLLKSAGIAVWDVLASCRRSGSLDSDIDATSVCPNDFNTFLLAHPHIEDIYFNGAMAEKCYLKHVQPRLEGRSLQIHRLPSTSPANASISYDLKLKAWRAVTNRFKLPE